MRARKFEIGLLVLFSLLGQAALAEPGLMTTRSVPAVAVVGDGHSPQARLVANPAQVMPRVEEIQFAGLSPTSEARAATLEAPSGSGSSTKDLLALILIAAMLVAYQLLRKHRLLRQQPFSL